MATQQAVVDEAITSRRSIRAFTDEVVSAETVSEILAVASRAPSGTNTQPWNVHVLSGEPKTRLSARVLEAFNDPAVAATHKSQYAYYPEKWSSPYIERRRKVGWDLYGLLELTREDKAGMHAQHGRNYQFFDAPVGLVFTIDDALALGSWLDYGMFIQNVMVAARGRGLDTCAQAAFTQYHQVIRDELGLPESSVVVCGMSLGVADMTAVENSLVSDREPVANFATFSGF